MFDWIDFRLSLVPGALIAAASAFNLRRYRKWRLTSGVLLERKALPAENMPDRIRVKYNINGASYVSEPAAVFGTFGYLNKIVKIGDSIVILYDPENPACYVVSTPIEREIVMFLIGLIMIILSQINFPLW